MFYMVKPMPFTVLAGNAQAQAPVSNLLLDHGGRVWRSNPSTSTVIDVQGDGSSINRLGLVGSNLQAGDTIALRFADNQAGLSAAPIATTVSVTRPDASLSAITPMIFDARPFRAVRMTITTPVARMVEAQRLSIGLAHEAVGIAPDAEQSFDDRSREVAGDNFSIFDDGLILPSWKIKINVTSYDEWKAGWQPFLNSVGTSRGVFVHADNLFTMFGRIGGKASFTAKSHKWWVGSFEVTAIAP